MPARTRSPAAPRNLRNGLKWRDGRPRWEPSPSARALGLKGMDLRRADGGWMDRGEAIAAADARKLWADLIREARSPLPDAERAQVDLRRALDALPDARDVADRQRRALVQDLLDHARATLGELDAAGGVRLRGGPRTVDRMIDGYLADTGVVIAEKTRRAYTGQFKRLRAKFGARRVDEVTRGEMKTWYEELAVSSSLAVANLCLGAAGAAFKWAVQHDWIAASPVTQLGMRKLVGRRVFWTLAEEGAFIAWCDAHDFTDVADGVTAALWTGARIGDICAADLHQLRGRAWRFTPQKTKRSGHEALPGLLPQVTARVERRAAQVVTSARRAFLVRPDGERHNEGSFGRRFRMAKAAALLADAVPATLADKRVQDCRDTCVTRLAAADVPFMKIWPWTGHSPKDAEDILREHYLTLREDGAVEAAGMLGRWAAANALSLTA